MKPCRSTQGRGGVPDGIPLGLSPGGLDSGSATESTAGRGGTDGNTGRGHGPKCMSTATGNKDQGVADSAAVHSKRN